MKKDNLQNQLKLYLKENKLNNVIEGYLDTNTKQYKIKLRPFTVFNLNTKVSIGYMRGLIVKITNNSDFDIANCIQAIQSLIKFKQTCSIN